MAGSVNKVILVGNLGKDPEIRHTQSGKKIANLTLATSENWRDRESGDRRERTEWHRVAIFSDGLANIAERFLRKGSKIYVEGQLQTRKWQDQQGQDRYTTEIILQNFNSVLTMLDTRGGGYDTENPGTGSRSATDESSVSSPSRNNSGSSNPDYSNIDDMDDDIPF